MLAKQKHTWKDKSKFCTNCKCKNHNAPPCWEEGSRNHANAPHWVKQGTNNAGEDKKRKGTKAYMTKEDSGSESATIACGSPKLHNTHNEDVLVTWDDTTLHRTHLKSESMPLSSGGDQTVAFMEDNPFCFDTGVMSHISPSKQNS